MKKLIPIITIIFATSLAIAEEVVTEEIPGYMKDGTITVTLKDGRVYTYSTNTHKVVRRGTGLKKKPAVAAETAKKKTDSGQNTVILHAGVGNNGLDKSVEGNTTTVTEDQDMVGAVTYCRNRDDKGLCLTGATNETFLLGVKFDF